MEIPRDQLDLRDDPAVLSPPIVTQPYACARVVNITGYVPDATLDVDIDGVTVVSGFPGRSPAPFGALVPLPVGQPALTPGQQVSARQRHGGAVSNPSPSVTVRDHTVEFPAGLPRPEIFYTPLYQCGTRTGIANLLVGCTVTLRSDGTTVGAVTSANNPQGVDVSPAFEVGRRVRAVAELCNDPSPPSVEQTVQVQPLPLPAPGYEPYYGGPDLVINRIVNGAQLTLSRNGTFVGTYPCWGDSLLVHLPPPYAATDTFSATQQLCPLDGPSPPGEMSGSPCSAMPAPQVGPIQAGQASVVVTAFVPGSRIKVFVNGVKTGDGSGPVIQLTGAIPPYATVHVWQIVGTCSGSTVQQSNARCVAPPIAGDPSSLNLFPVGTHEYHAGTTTIDGFTYDVKGSIYYPADDDGADKPFNGRLAALGRVPLVVCVHGAHSPATPSYLGYDYFQYQLARMGFVAVSVDERQTDIHDDWAKSTQNIVRRAELAIATIAYLQQLDTTGPILQGRIDFGRTGLMGHSRGGDCVLAMRERNALPGVTIRAILSLAPVDSGAHNGRPRDCAFMTILPAADGDVVGNDGAKFYDQAQPSPVKVQLYVDHANHNFFNRQWLNDDTSGGLPIMSRPEHERILSAYGCAFFRSTLRNDPTLDYLLGRTLPGGVQNQNIHLSYEVAGARVVDNYERHPITIDNEGQATSQSGGLSAATFPFAQTAGAFNSSFFGNTNGNVSRSVGRFREPLNGFASLERAEVRVRAAEVFEGAIAPSPTGFRVGVEDSAGTVAWIDVDNVGGLPRPFDRTMFDGLTKTMPTTFRFPGSCFQAVAPHLRLDAIRAVLLGLNRDDQRPIAFDDVEITQG